jgi:cbb3-type cytochrome oxidase maturation protein
MAILIVLIPLGLVLLGIAVAAFIWAVRHDQFEDLESEGSRILFEEEPHGEGQGSTRDRKGARD